MWSCRSLSFTPAGSCTPGAGSMHQGGHLPGNAFRRVNSSCNTFGGIPQSPRSGRPGSRAAFSPVMDQPLSYPASPAARTIDRRWSFSGGSQPSPHYGYSTNSQVWRCSCTHNIYRPHRDIICGHEPRVWFSPLQKCHVSVHSQITPEKLV